MIKLPKPPSNSNGRHHVSESHRLVRERSFPNHHNVEIILDELRETRSTGQLVIDLSQGGVGAIRFREEQKVDFTEFP